MANEAVTNAVKDAGVSYKDFEQAFVGYVYGNDDEKEKDLIFTDHTGRQNHSVDCNAGHDLSQNCHVEDNCSLKRKSD
jgi:hypothetical protein